VTEKPSLNGACSCASVKYHADADFRRVVNCHCKLCRKMNGSAFSSYVTPDYQVIELPQRMVGEP
jgi:hypothetical protein